MKNRRTFKILGSGPWQGRVFYVHVESRTGDIVSLVLDEVVPELSNTEISYDMNHGMKLGGVYTDLLYLSSEESTKLSQHVDNNWSC